LSRLNFSLYELIFSAGIPFKGYLLALSKIQGAVNRPEIEALSSVFVPVPNRGRCFLQAA
jgi:hypothetical protein